MSKSKSLAAVASAPTPSSPPPPAPPASTKTTPAYRLRRSSVHGMGVFATRVIQKGATIIEYIGERISHEEADRRHANKAANDGHTFLFTVDAKTVIDAGSQGNTARFINHSCDPNCEVILDDGRLFVEAVRMIGKGEELGYDYNINRAPEDPPEVEKVFACRCGAATCRGTMLAPHKKPKSKSKAKAKAKAKKTLLKKNAQKKKNKNKSTRRAGGDSTRSRS